jgi:hypothetical protein
MNNENENDFIATDKNTDKGGENDKFDCDTRNLMVLRFFKQLFPKNDIRIMADENNPAVVIDHEYILSVWVKNHKLRFMNKNQKGEILFELSLNTEFKKLTPQQIDQLNNWYTKNQHRKVKRIYLECENTQAPLYLVGWNFRNKTLKEGKYPVFGEYEPKVYFTKDRAVEIQTELIQMGYNVIII